MLCVQHDTIHRKHLAVLNPFQVEFGCRPLHRNQLSRLLVLLVEAQRGRTKRQVSTWNPKEQIGTGKVELRNGHEVGLAHGDSIRAPGRGGVLHGLWAVVVLVKRDACHQLLNLVVRVIKIRLCLDVQTKEPPATEPRLDDSQVVALLLFLHLFGAQLLQAFCEKKYFFPVKI